MSATVYPYQEQANFAAVLEKYFGELEKSKGGGNLEDILFKILLNSKPDNLTEEESQKYVENAMTYAATFRGYVLREVGSFDKSPSCKEKALVISTPDNGLYVHFRGTGDGNWGYNTAVFGTEPQPSDMQKWACEYFEEILQNYPPTGNVYVTGHSQGGHNAQYVTLHAQSAERITACISMDGPGHSTKSLEEIKLNGDYYEQQRHKIYAYNGCSDYVSCLGQEQVVPVEHTFYIETPEKNGEDIFNRYHAANYLLNDDNQLNRIHRADENPEQPFRQMVKLLNEKICQLSQEEQELVAITIMEICEKYVGDRSKESYLGSLTPEDFSAKFEKLKTILIPMLLDVMEEHPDLLENVLEQIDLDHMLLGDNSENGAIAALIMDVIKELDSLPRGMRQEVLEYILQYVVVKENGELGFDQEAFIAELGEHLPELIDIWAIVQDTLLTNPGDVVNLLNELKVGEMIANFVKEHPIEAIGITVIAAVAIPILLQTPIIGTLTTLIVLTDALIEVTLIAIKTAYAAFTAVSEALKKAADFVVNCLQCIQRTISRIGTWLHNKLNAGARYVRDNPYFKVDTGKLRDYAGRIRRVNQRLRTLDSDLRGLYWQVGFLDLWDILIANLLTSGSPTLNQVESWLNHAAQSFDTAESKAGSYF